MTLRYLIILSLISFTTFIGFLGLLLFINTHPFYSLGIAVVSSVILFSLTYFLRSEVYNMMNNDPHKATKADIAIVLMIFATVLCASIALSSKAFSQPISLFDINDRRVERPIWLPESPMTFRNLTTDRTFIIKGLEMKQDKQTEAMQAIKAMSGSVFQPIHCDTTRKEKTSLCDDVATKDGRSISEFLLNNKLATKTRQ